MIERHGQPPCPPDCAACLIASRMRRYVPQRQMLPDIASSSSESVGCGLLASSAEADMIWPDWQYPHCTTSRSSQAFWILAPAAVAPMASMVVTSDLPMLSIGVTQERVALPSMCTVQAPHSAMPQPNLVPVIPSTSRSTHKSGVSPSTSTVRSTPLILMVVAIATSRPVALIGHANTSDQGCRKMQQGYPAGSCRPVDRKRDPSRHCKLHKRELVCCE